MKMLNRSVMILGLTAAGAAGAAEPAEPAGPDPHALGLVDAVMSHCASVDPQNADHYRERGRQLGGDAGSEVLKTVRSSEEYRAAYESAVQSLEGAPLPDAVKSCRASLPAEK